MKITKLFTSGYVLVKKTPDGKETLITESGIFGPHLCVYLDIGYAKIVAESLGCKIVRVDVTTEEHV